MSYIDFKNNTYWNLYGLIHPLGFVVNISYWFMGDVMGRQGHAEELFKKRQNMSSEEKRAWMSETLRKRRGIKPKNPKL